MEILCQIFGYLEFSDRKNVSQCCKRWRYIFLENNSLRDILIKANNHLFLSRPVSSQKSTSIQLAETHRAASSMALSSFATLLKFNLYLYSNAVNLEFENDSADVSLFLRNLKHALVSNYVNENDAFLLPKLESLKFTKTTMSSKTLIDLVQETPQLQWLMLDNCDSLFMTGFLSSTANTLETPFYNFLNLTQLSLSRNRYLTDFVLNLFVNSAPNLKSLDLSYCCLTKTNFKSIPHGTTLGEPNKPSNVVLTVENLIKLMSRKIECLNLSGIDMFNYDESRLIELASKVPELSEIYLAHLPNIKAETVSKLFKLLPKLRLIDLGCSMQLDDSNLQTKSIEAIFVDSLVHNAENEGERLANLQVIKMSKAKINNPQIILDQIGHFNMLTYLDLSNIMFKRSFATVTRLNQYIEELALKLASYCSQIEYLLLGYCDFLVNDTFVRIISKGLRKLKHLDLRNCSKITDISLHYISYYLHKLIHLDVSWCQHVSNKGLGVQIENDQILLNEFNYLLKSSCLRCTKKFNEQPFLLLKTKAQLANDTRENVCNCTSLISNVIEQTTDKHERNVLEHQTLGLRNLRLLRVLKMEACVNITDEGLLNGVNLLQLQEIDLKLCTGLTGDFMDGINFKQNTFSCLKALNLNQCVKFKETNLIKIIENSPNLRQLNCSAISSITNQIIEVLFKQKKLLTYFDISFCPNVNESAVDKYEQFLYNEFGSREFHLDKRFITK